jgi:hypothetical protein
VEPVATVSSGRRVGPLAIGFALVALYAAAVTGTLPFGHNVRPLFEGIGPPPAYRWVKPPAAFASGNVPPKANDTDVPMLPTGSQQSGAQSEDNQLVLNLAANAAPPHQPDTTVVVHIDPLDPATLGPTPPDLRPNGNAYHVSLLYKPSGTPVATVTTPGNILLTIPLPNAGLLFSPDGKTWTKIGTGTVAGQAISLGPFNSAGWYMGATHGTTATTGGGGSGGGSGGTIVVVVLVAGLALILGLTPFILRRVRGGGRPAPKKGSRPQQAQRKRKKRR